MIGQTISHYRITEKLGEGGMGVVYKAEDTSLDRPVALKFLAPHLVSDEEIRKRFEREAKAAAALNHPNVCTVHEIAEAQGRTFIAMAFLEGEGLDKKIEAGPLKLKDALEIAIQTAHGLQAAHEKKIIHRDIKPANLMITGSGSKQLVTIMDFGLALLTDLSKLTRTDETMGTVTYMSPEQTYGMELDHRTDIWSLGTVIYELVTGQQPFKGHYDKAVMYSITNEEPEPMTALRTGVPMELEWLVNKALAKERDERYQSTADMVVDLESLKKKLESGKSTILRAQAASQTVITQPTATEEFSPGPLARYRVIEDIEEADDSIKYLAEDTELHRSVAIRVLPQSSADRVEQVQRRKQTVAFGVGALGVLLALIFALFLLFSPAPVAETPLRRFAIVPPVSVPTNIVAGRHNNFLAISPNGRHIAFVEAGGQGRLWVQDLDQEQPRAIEGTEGATSPFWSPDSTFIGFAAGGEVKKISVRGGLAGRVCELPAVHFHGGTWSPDGEVIVFSSGPLAQPHSLYEVPALGGVASLLLGPKDMGEASEGLTKYLAWSHFLPSEAGARVLVLTYGSTSNEQIMVVQDLETGQRELLGPGAAPVYSNSGHLVYATSPASSDLWALPFSLETLRATGEAFPVSENSRYATVAADGTLVYLATLGASAQRQLIWVDRDGNKVEEIGQPHGYVSDPALSPDGRWVAVAVGDDISDRDVWAWDLARGVSNRLSTASESARRPVWSPGGDEVAFGSSRAGSGDIYLAQADASGEEQELLATPQDEWPSDWSRDGKYLLYQRRDAETGSDLWYLERSEDRSGWEAHPFLQQRSLLAAKFSPNGLYVAYVSTESGQVEVYVQPFPGGGHKVTVSKNGGHQVRLSQDGNELFYVQGEKLMAVSVSTEGEFSPGSPREVFEHPGLLRVLNYPAYDVSLDGRKFILSERVGYEETQTAQPKIRIVQNWHEEFRDREQDYGMHP